MRGAMMRNTRAVVALKLPRRHAVTVARGWPEGERQAYRELAAAARRLAAEGANRLALRHLLGAAGSSPAAAAAAVRRLSGRHVDASWHALAQRWASIGAGGKEAALIDLLRRNPGEKKLVFVHYRETLEHLAELLAREGFAFARFEGALSGPDKDAAIARFRERVPVLLCTESGGEGRNIQFCNTLINFDVPWNPMAIEQRIGRIDRIGQQREVFVFNLVTRGTLEEQILHLLDEKISMFELVVGEVGAILGGLDEDRDFADLMLDAWLHTTEAGRAEAFDALGRRLQGSAGAPRECQGARRRPVRRRLRDRVSRADERAAGFRRRPAGAPGRGRRGARAGRLEVLAPAPLRTTAGLARARASRLRNATRPGTIAIALEGDWLDRFGALLGDEGRWSEREVRLPAPVPPPSDPERLLDRALDLPNAVWRFQGMSATWTRCLMLAFRYTAVSDEKREGLIWLGFNLGTGAVINDILARLRPALAQMADWHVPDPATRRAAGPGWSAATLAARLRPLLERAGAGQHGAVSARDAPPARARPQSRPCLSRRSAQTRR